MILVLREHFFCTTKSGIFRFFGQKGTFLMGGPFLGFRSTPSSYRLVPKLARRDRFKNDKIGPKQWLPRNFWPPSGFPFFGPGWVTFLAKIFFLFFSSFLVARTHPSCVKITINFQKFGGLWVVLRPTEHTSPPKNFDPIRFSIFWSGRGHFFGENFFQKNSRPF